MRASRRLPPWLGPLGALVVLSAGLVGCGGGGSADEPADARSGEPPPAAVAPDVAPADRAAGPETTPTAAVDPARPAATDPSGVALPPDPASAPPVDLASAIVPLEEVVFDTFDGGSARLTDAPAQLIEELRDAIAPIYQPVYGAPADLPWLGSDDLVLGYEAGGQAYAYPVKVLNFRELVNDVIDGRAVLVSYCPLCGSGVVFERELEGEVLLFGNTSALFENDLVAFDWQTGSYWFQVAGRSIVGELSGAELEALPSSMTTWGDWQALHPETIVLVGDGEEVFAESRYGRDPFAGYEDVVDAGRFPFPVTQEALDGRLRAGAPVLVVETGDAAKAYPINAVGSVVNDLVGSTPVAVIGAAQGVAAFAYERSVDGQTLTLAETTDGLRDAETGTSWDAAGRAVDGPLAGARLEPLPTRRALWFSVGLAYPGIELYEPG